MLDSLHIENIAVIKCTDIDFNKGFTVFTGETGAGKSIIIDSIKLILGARADKDLIRTGEEEAYVSASFCVDDKSIEEELAKMDVEPDCDGNIIFSRNITRDGKNRSKINGRAVPISVMEAAGKLLIAIHGQHDSMALFDPATHIRYLDSYAETEDLISEYYLIYKEMNRIKTLLKEESTWLKNTEKTVPLLKAQIKEIDEAGIKLGEEEKLREKLKKLKNSAKLSKLSAGIKRALVGTDNIPGCVELIRLAKNAIERAGDDIEGSDDYIERLSGISAELSEIAEDIAYMSGDGEFDDPEEALDRIQTRLEVISKIHKKYGVTGEDVLRFRENAIADIKRTEESANICKGYLSRLNDLSKDAFRLSDIISEKRNEGARELEKKIMAELKYLELEKVRFEVSIKKATVEGGIRLMADGSDIVEFLVSTNPGEDAKPLSKIASGGEMSRIMMAFRCVFADKYKIPSMIFDEIDTGVSGKTSEKIGIKLKQISRSGAQVFCVTHAAQVASCADNHLKISKHEKEGRIETKVELLTLEGRIDELSRIMGGINITESIKNSAKELIYKNSSVE